MCLEHGATCASYPWWFLRRCLWLSSAVQQHNAASGRMRALTDVNRHRGTPVFLPCCSSDVLTDLSSRTDAGNDYWNGKARGHFVEWVTSGSAVVFGGHFRGRQYAIFLARHPSTSSTASSPDRLHPKSISQFIPHNFPPSSSPLSSPTPSLGPPFPEEVIVEKGGREGRSGSS